MQSFKYVAQVKYLSTANQITCAAWTLHMACHVPGGCVGTWCVGEGGKDVHQCDIMSGAVITS